MSARREGPHADLTERIIGAAMRVLNALKPGLDEKVYETALVVELAEHGLAVEQQRDYAVYYKERLVGRLVPDLIVEGRVIVDAKVVEAFNDTHVAQMLGYLAITGLEVALLVSFKHARLKWRRIIRSGARIPDGVGTADDTDGRGQGSGAEIGHLRNLRNLRLNETGEETGSWLFRMRI